jgi:hypothetical protein
MPGTVWTAETGVVVDVLEDDRVFELLEPPPPHATTVTDTAAAAIKVGINDRGRRRGRATATGAPRSSVMDSPSGARDVART